MNYIPALCPALSTKIEPDACCFIFHGRKIALYEDRIPRLNEIAGHESFEAEMLYIGTLDGRQCFCVELADAPETEMHDLRGYINRMDAAGAAIISRAVQLARWHIDSGFCGGCGTENAKSASEFAKKCPQCGRVHFPRLCPAVIVAVSRNDRILLAHNKHFRPGLYSAIAGFVEAGESLEECVEREIYEEVGIRVKNIQYFGSQSWPFPHSLMIGFSAEYASGELTPDGNEIIDAKWFAPNELPEIPSPGSISRQLIDNFLCR